MVVMVPTDILVPGNRRLSRSPHTSSVHPKMILSFRPSPKRASQETGTFALCCHLSSSAEAIFFDVSSDQSGLITDYPCPLTDDVRQAWIQVTGVPVVLTVALESQVKLSFR